LTLLGDATVSAQGKPLSHGCLLHPILDIRLPRLTLTRGLKHDEHRISMPLQSFECPERSHPSPARIELLPRYRGGIEPRRTWYGAIFTIGAISQMMKLRELTVTCYTKSASVIEGKVTVGEEKSSFSERRPFSALRPICSSPAETSVTLQRSFQLGSLSSS
jgi:hypothetical protein